MGWKSLGGVTAQFVVEGMRLLPQLQSKIKK